MIPSIDPYVILVAIIAIFLAILSALCILIAIRNNRRKLDHRTSPERTPNVTRSRCSISSALPSRPCPSRPCPSRTTALPALPTSASHASPVSLASDDAIRTDINAIINKHLSKEPTQ